MKKTTIQNSILIILAIVAAIMYNKYLIPATTSEESKESTTNHALVVSEGVKVYIEYTGKLEDGKVFDTSVGKAPLSFIVGTGRVIEGFDSGVLGLEVGDKKTLIIPPSKAYGVNGIPGVIPPNATLTFDIEVKKIEDPSENSKTKEPKVKKSLTNINNEELKKIMTEKSAILIDIRRPEEWKQTGIIPTSNLITLYDKNGKQNDDFQAKFDKLVPTRDTAFVMICRTGNRTTFATTMLATNFGYTNVYNLEKGITDWISSEGKVIKN
jgi:rhodanese-related sulfurtransferase